ncbi:hypothetical protein J4211_01275 [Candidatus Woesearchaeota archaeon]|nr:hypothetical protein [Candidatus Woesearchaeota archaeon]
MLSPFLKKLLFARQLDLSDGKIEILGKKQVMLPAEVLVALQSVDPKKSYTLVKKTINSSMEDYAKKVGSTSEGLLKVLEEIFETFGLGKPEINALDNSKKTASIKIRDCPLRNPSVKLGPEHGILPCAALAGMFSFLFKTNMDCTVKISGSVLECTIRRSP